MQQYKELNIRELRKLFPRTAVCDDLSDDIFIAEMRHDSIFESLIEYPCRFNGYLAFFCYSGHLNVEINMRTFHIKEGTLLIYTPGNIVRVPEPPSEKERRQVHFTVTAVSQNMMNMTHLDFNKMYEESLRLMNNPCVELSQEERATCRKYFDLFKDMSRTSLPGIRDAISSLMTSVFYLMGAMWSDRLSEARMRAAESNRSVRSKAVFEDFITLVKENHNKERNLSFYAEKLYLTPKYLSKLIKTVSGKSAHEWIDSFVVLEAKNRLKYSDMSIKAIVWELNFPNQTTFYRFFKAHTGMTPSEYRKA